MPNRPGHDDQCEWGTPIDLDMGGLPPKEYVREECRCATRAYLRNPLPDVSDPQKE